MKHFTFTQAKFSNEFLDGLHWIHSERAQFVDEDFDPIPTSWMPESDLDTIVGIRQLSRIAECATAIDASYGDYELQTVVYLALKHRQLSHAELFEAVIAELS
jgi:hypothetical protein